jgi:Domain of unknown function DUF29
MKTQVEYDKDFYGWLLANAQLIREKKRAEVYAEHIAEELGSMGKSERRELVSRLTVLLAHLLKWRFQPAKRSRSRRNTILTQRIDIDELLEDSPSLGNEVGLKIETAYEKAKLRAEDETGIDQGQFPDTCPFSVDEVLDKHFFANENGAQANG